MLDGSPAAAGAGWRSSPCGVDGSARYDLMLTLVRPPRGAAGRIRLQHRPLHGGDGAAHARPPAAPAGGGDRRPGLRLSRSPPAGRRRARAAPVRASTHAAAVRKSAPRPRGDRGAGAPAADALARRLRGGAAELRASSGAPARLRPTACAPWGSAPRRGGLSSSARSPWSGLLGVLTAGGAYLPIDPGSRLAGGLHAGGRAAVPALVTGSPLAARCPTLASVGPAGRAAPRRRPSPSRGRWRAGEPGLRDLHLGLDRHAQGGGGQPPAPSGHARDLGAVHEVGPGGPRAPALVVQLRLSAVEHASPLTAGGALAAWPATMGAATRRRHARRPRRDGWSTCATALLGGSAPATRRRSPDAARCSRRRGAARRDACPRAAPPGARPRCRCYNGYGPTEAVVHRDPARVDGRSGQRAACRSAGRSPTRGAYVLGRGAAAGARRRARRALHRRRRRSPAATSAGRR